jgi:hypothetical protein
MVEGKLTSQKRKSNPDSSFASQPQSDLSKVDLSQADLSQTDNQSQMDQSFVSSQNDDKSVDRSDGGQTPQSQRKKKSKSNGKSKPTKDNGGSHFSSYASNAPDSQDSDDSNAMIPDDAVDQNNRPLSKFFLVAVEDQDPYNIHGPDSNLSNL